VCHCTILYREEVNLESTTTSNKYRVSLPPSCPYFSKLHKQSRMCLAFSCPERSAVQASFCGNDERIKVLGDWLKAKKPRDLLKKIALGGNHGSRSQRFARVLVRALYRRTYTQLDNLHPVGLRKSTGI